MKKNIIFRCILLCLAVLLISGATSALILQRVKEQDVLKTMDDLITIIALEEQLDESRYGEFVTETQETSMDYRITVLDRSGNVIADSYYDSESLENHADRQEFKQALAAGRGSSKRYSDTYGQDMLYYARLEGDVIYRCATPAGRLNATILELLPALLAGILVAGLISPLLASRIAHSITKPLSDTAESLRPLSDGTFEVKTMPARYSELQPIADTINSLAQRISHSMQELSEQKEKTDYLLDNMADGLLLVDGKGRVRQINNAARRYLGDVTSAEGEMLLVFTHQRRLVKAVDRALQDGESSLFDLEESPLPGRTLSAHVTALQADWLTEPGSPNGNGAVILLTDVTPIRRAEQMRSEFVANASHELKTPITSIGGFAELLAAGAVTDPAKQKEYLERIQSETHRMAMLIEDILRLSRLESDASEEIHAPVPVARVIEDALEGLRPQIEQKGISVKTDLETLSVQALPDDIRALVVNLLDNAVKYNRSGGTLGVSLHANGTHACFVVSDTGIGIPPEHQSRIFERFYRVDKGRSRSAGGTGLGLAIVKHVTVKYGGEITLQSAEGKGTTISVSLPLT